MSENPFRDVRKKIGTSSSSFGLVRDGRSIKFVHETPETDPRQVKFLLLFSIGGFAFLFLITGGGIIGEKHGTSGLLFYLSLLFAIVSVAVGLFFIIRSKWTGDRTSQAINNEIELLANDASFDVSEQIIVWDRLLLTKGLGTQLEGREDEISQVHRRLVNSRQEIAAAESPQHQLEAVMAADSILATARSLQ